MKTYKLNRDWTMFSEGELFEKADDECVLYTLVSNEDILARIPDEYLDEQSHAWRPGHNETYYYIDDNTAVEATVFYDCDADDEGRLAIGNFFETDEEGGRMRDWLEARQMLINSGAKFTNRADGTCYSVRYNKTDNTLDVYRHIYKNDLYVGAKVLCFTDNQLAEDSIEKHKENWLVYLGVKEKSGGES